MNYALKSYFVPCINCFFYDIAGRTEGNLAAIFSDFSQDFSFGLLIRFQTCFLGVKFCGDGWSCRTWDQCHCGVLWMCLGCWQRSFRIIGIGQVFSSCTLQG